MFSISEYNNLLNPFNISDIVGGKKGNRVMAAIKSMSIYLMVSLILIFELLEPLTTDDAFNRLNENQGVKTSFVIMSFIAPLIVLLMMYSFNIFDGEQKRKSVMLFMSVSIILLLLHFSLTIAALVIGEAYSDEKDSEKRAKKMGFLYTKVILLFAGQGFALWNGFTK